MKSGFGSKGFSRSPIQYTGIRTYAQKFGSLRSAFTSIIPAYANFNVWSSFDPNTYTVVTSGSTSVVSNWVDVVNAKSISQSNTASMPTLDFAINNKFGLRFVIDDYLFGTADDKNSAPSGSEGWYMTYGVHMRYEQDNTQATGLENHFITIPNSQAALWTNEWFSGFNFYHEGGVNKRYFFRYATFVFGGNKGFLVASPTFNPNFATATNVNNYKSDYIYYFTIGSTATRSTIWQISDKYGNVLYAVSGTYDSAYYSTTTASWDASVFGGPNGPALLAHRPTTGRRSADCTYYTSLQFGTTTMPSADILKKTTQYLESIYGVM